LRHKMQMQTQQRTPLSNRRTRNETSVSSAYSWNSTKRLSCHVNLWEGSYKQKEYILIYSFILNTSKPIKILSRTAEHRLALIGLVKLSGSGGLLRWDHETGLGDGESETSPNRSSSMYSASMSYGSDGERRASTSIGPECLSGVMEARADLGWRRVTLFITKVSIKKKNENKRKLIYVKVSW